MSDDQPGGGAATRYADQFSRMRSVADDGHLKGACGHRFGHGKGPARKTWVLSGKT